MVNLNELTNLVNTVFPGGEVFLIIENAYYKTNCSNNVLFELKVGFDHVRCVAYESMSAETVARVLCDYMCQFKLGNNK